MDSDARKKNNPASANSMMNMVRRCVYESAYDSEGGGTAAGDSDHSQEDEGAGGGGSGGGVLVNQFMRFARQKRGRAALAWSSGEGGKGFFKKQPRGVSKGFPGGWPRRTSKPEHATQTPREQKMEQPYAPRAGSLGFDASKAKVPDYQGWVQLNNQRVWLKGGKSAIEWFASDTATAPLGSVRSGNVLAVSADGKRVTIQGAAKSMTFESDDAARWQYELNKLL